MSPSDVDQTGLWQFLVAMNGYAEANGRGGPSADDLTDQHLADLGIEGF